MAEKAKIGLEENEKQPRTRAEILGDLLALREKASKGEVGLDKMIAANYGAAKELLEIGEEQSAFEMMTSTTQLEASYIGRTTAVAMEEVANGINFSSRTFNESVNEFMKSNKGFVEGAEILQGVGARISGAAEEMTASSVRMDNASNQMQTAGNKMDNASGVIHEASMRMSR